MCLAQESIDLQVVECTEPKVRRKYMYQDRFYGTSDAGVEIID